VHTVLRLIAAGFLLAAFAFAPAQAADLSPLSIETPSGSTHKFKIEVADDPQVRAQGLMYRRSLPADYGMLFDFEEDQSVSMWMKNTYVSLDMLFILSDGTVHRIEQNTTPLSTRTIDSGVPVRYVLELPAGTSARLAITRGSKVRHAIIGK